jgi:mannose-6-phosphate isomerase-like protein (cupin superfamily)
MNRCLHIIHKLLEDSSLYLDLIKPENGEIRVCIELSDTREAATLVLGEAAEAVEGEAKPDIRLIMERETLEDIAEGRADAFALAGRGGADEKRPIEFEVHSEERSKEVWETTKALLTYFFTPGRIKIRRLSPELAGQAHGAHPIPLVYWNGLRFSWIHVKHGEVLNEEGEKDPWPQAFFILEGKGKAVVGDELLDIEPETAIYIPVNSIHKITATEDVRLLWIAWNAR